MNYGNQCKHIMIYLRPKCILQISDAHSFLSDSNLVSFVSIQNTRLYDVDHGPLSQSRRQVSLKETSVNYQGGSGKLESRKIKVQFHDSQRQTVECDYPHQSLVNGLKYNVFWWHWRRSSTNVYPVLAVAS